MEAKIWTYSAWIDEIDPDKLKELFEKSLLDAGFELCGYVDHQFQPVGYTGTWVLAESHFSFHTFPEKECCYFELASCNVDKYDKFKEVQLRPDIQGVKEVLSQP